LQVSWNSRKIKKFANRQDGNEIEQEEYEKLVSFLLQAS